MLSLIIGYTVLSLKVAIGLGFVIFVHELGHFLVAKFCGVKCEKFYLGFDFWGLKLCKFRAGETEYGIGIFPLGGYVKMLGQEDNPGKIKEETERAKEKGERGQDASVPSDAAKKSEGNPVYDPRSFLAKSVPKRMAIIAAGVIMNVIFAFVMAVVAVSPWMGVPTPPCLIGEVLSGDPAWKADLRPGDEVLTIAGKPMRQFRDLQAAISLGDINTTSGVQMRIRRPGVKEPFDVTVRPDRSIGAFFIGVRPGFTTSLAQDRKTWLVKKRFATIPGTAAGRAEPAFRCGDTIVQIDDSPIDNYGQIEAKLAQSPDKTLKVVVERTARDAKGKATGNAERLTVPVGPNPMRDLGLVMKMGRITAIQDGSPAAAAGIKAGDKIVMVDGGAVGDPMSLPARLDHRAGQTVRLTIERKGEKSPTVVSVRLRQPIEIATPGGVSGSVAVSSLGVAYRVLDQVERVVAGGPAGKAELRSGDTIVKATLIPPAEKTAEAADYGQSEVTLSKETANEQWWPVMMALMQQCLPGTKVEVTYVRPGVKEKTVTLTPTDVTGWNNPDRGFQFEPMAFDLRAQSVGDAFALGGRETLESLTMVVRTVQKLSSSQVSLRLIAGPKTIVMMALDSADQGTARLLLFLTLLSANLAIINFLPIPVLDGGNFVLLCYEGIRGKPAPESVQVVLSYIGLILVLALMVWALGLDFHLFSRR
ncbi:MAG: site-2 protease family protein [Planctomycetaceae bacterium]|nr:site-2 protease family protein [Planctomycetaceae bacterium]